MSNVYSEKYAIAINDSQDFFLMFEIKRYASGDVYFHFNKRDRKHKPHSSYHATGQVHHKSYNRTLLPPVYKQPPQDMFTGSEPLITTSIRKGEGRAWNRICIRGKYKEIMEINDAIIAPEGYQFLVELVEPNTEPWVTTYPYAKIVQQQVFTGYKPWIVASLYEMSEMANMGIFG